MTLDDPLARNAAVVMVRDTLDDVPDAALPTGCSVRAFATGDEPVWTAIQAAADAYNAIGPTRFADSFGTDAAAHRARILFVTDAGGRAIGTATAWWGVGAWAGWGRLHWVAVLPDEQGRGIGRALVVAACRRLRELGHPRACLTTSAARLAAIHLYDALGFRPFIAGDDGRVWRAIAAAQAARGTPLAMVEAR